MRLHIKTRYRLQKKFVVFFTVVPLLTITAMVQVDCPVCEGRGTISGSRGMENVRITEFDSRARHVMKDACIDWVTYLYDVTLSLQNEGADAAQGWIKLVLMDTREDKIMSIRFLSVEVPAQIKQRNAYLIYFGSDTYEQLRTEVYAEVIIGEITDITCNGTGKVSLNELFFVNTLKHTLQETVQIQHPYRPGWEEIQESLWEAGD